MPLGKAAEGSEDLLRQLLLGMPRVARSPVACAPSRDGSSLSWLILDTREKDKPQAQD